MQQLKIAWQWEHGEKPLEEYGTVPYRFENQPLMVDGVLYVTTPYNNAAALDAETGKELWRFDSGAVKLGGIPGTGFKHRAPGAVARRQGRQQAARAAEHPQPAVQPRRADRQAGRLVRRPTA